MTEYRALQNMAANCKRDLPWFTGGPVHKGEFVIVGGGPSLLTRMDTIARRQVAGATVLVCNGANLLLRANGIEPDLVLFVDPGQTVTGFIDEGPSESIYLVASICDPAVFDALEGREVFVWHPELTGHTDEQAAIFDLYPDKPCVLIGGGNTGAMRSMNIQYLLGYRTLHMYGVDSSYPKGGADHAYTKHEGHEPKPLTILFDGKHYCASPWMVRQADEFKLYFAQLMRRGCNVHVHGDGLIPDIARYMKHLVREHGKVSLAVH